MEVRDFLCDNGYYQDQMFAMAFVDLLWAELRRRTQWTSAFPVFTLDQNKIEPAMSWQDAIGYSFCLMLTFLQRYSRKQHKKLHGASYVRQGELFERFSEESLSSLGWKSLRTGWASGISNSRFKSLIDRVSKELNEDWVNKPAIALFKKAKDEGLDLVVHRPFTDGRWGRPYFLVQCASGGDWENKLHTPDLDVWKALVSFTTGPKRGFCFPLALGDDEFRMSCVKCSGMLLDRYRLVSSGTGVASGLSSALLSDLQSWLDPRVKALPLA